MMLDDSQEELENDVYKWLNRSIAPFVIGKPWLVAETLFEVPNSASRQTRQL